MDVRPMAVVFAGTDAYKVIAEVIQEACESVGKEVVIKAFCIGGGSGD